MKVQFLFEIDKNNISKLNRKIIARFEMNKLKSHADVKDDTVNTTTSETLKTNSVLRSISGEHHP